MRLALRSERDVETKLVGPLFQDVLKYPAESLHWDEPVPMVLGREKKTKKADLVAYHNSQAVVIVEAKSPREPIQSGIGQVDSYAFALQTPYSVITNGKQFLVRGYYSFNSRINIIQETVPRLQMGRWRKVGNLIGFNQVLDTLREKAEPVAVPDAQKIKDFRRFFRRIHSEIRDRDRLDPAAAFDELSKLLFLKAAEEDWRTRNPSRSVLSPRMIAEWEEIGDVKALIDRWFQKAVAEFYSDVFENDPRIGLKAETLKRVLDLMRPFQVRDGDVDVKGRAFEEFLPSQLRGKALGQYFTPRRVVDFMVEIAGVSIKDVVVDFSCGSGGFLIKTFDTMKSRVEELPEGIVTRMGTTRHDIMEAIRSDQIHGIDAEPRAARTAKMNMLMWGDGRRVVRGNGLDVVDHEGRPYTPAEFSPSDRKSGCTLILANPPFGSSEKDAGILSRYRLGSKDVERSKERTEILFLEKGLRLLRPEGRMLIVLPQGIFQTISDQRVRDYLHSECEIRAIISLPTHTFVQSGVQTVNACVVYLQKFTEEKKALYDKKAKCLSQKDIRLMLQTDPDFDYTIFMGTAEFIGFEPSGRSIVKPGEKTDLELLLSDFENQANLAPADVNLFDVATEHYGDKSHKRSEQTVRGTTRGLKTAFTIRLSETENRLDPPFYLFRYQATDLLDSLEPLGDSVVESGERFRPTTDEERDAEYHVLSVGKDGVTEGKIRSGWDFRDNYRYQRVVASDIVYNPSRINIGSIGVVPEKFSGDLVSPEYIILRSSRLDPTFLVDLVRSPFYRMYINVITTGSIRNRLYFRDIKKIRVPNVSGSVQGDIYERGRRVKFIMDAARKRAASEVESSLAELHSLVALRSIESTEPAFDEVFRDLAASWRKQSCMLSSVAAIATHPAYQKIIGMGDNVVPLILSDFVQNGPDHWFWALAAITRENPVSDAMAGDLEQMTEAWLEWGRQRGYPIASKTST